APSGDRTQAPNIRIRASRVERDRMLGIPSAQPNSLAKTARKLIRVQEASPCEEAARGASPVLAAGRFALWLRSCLNRHRRPVVPCSRRQAASAKQLGRRSLAHAPGSKPSGSSLSKSDQNSALAEPASL